MNVDKDMVSRFADLALLELSSSEIGDAVIALTMFSESIARTWSNNSNAHETDPVPEFYDPREDRIRPSLSAEAAVSNACDSEGGFFRIPPILDASA